MADHAETGHTGSPRLAVWLALAANILVAAAKIVGGALTGSSAMLAESAHSLADTLNESFLLTALRRSARPADERHPFGYGKERFFWSLLAAVGIMVAGAGFSGLEAYRAFTVRATAGPRYFTINYLILAIAAIAEGASWGRAMWQLRGQARAAQRGLLEHIKASSDPSLKTVASEDAAALAGVLLAGIGLLLHQLTGSSRFEGVAAAAIAVLLVIVAVTLGRDTKELLIGEAAVPELTDEVEHFLQSEREDIDEVVDVLTMHLGVESILLAARVDFASELDSDQVERISHELDVEIQRRWPAVTHVFIDATNASEQVDRVGRSPRAAG
jgi:cation diffusion facilitator family transporter